MISLDYDERKKMFKATLKKNTAELRGKIMQVYDAVESIDGTYWSIPRTKKALRKLQKLFGRSMKISNKALSEMHTLAKEGDITLDYDKKTNKFELYVPLNSKNREILVFNIGDARKRKSKNCWSLPNNYWTLLQIYKYYPKEQINPTSSAKKILDQYSEKMNHIFNFLNPRLETIKQVDVSKVPIDFEFKGKYDLFEHQIKMFWAAKEYLKAGAGFAFFADAGTGKSAPAVNVIEYLLEKKYIEKCLIITPASLKYNFAEQFQEHSSISPNVLYSYDKDKRKGKKGRRWLWTKSNVDIEEYYEGYDEYLENEVDSPVQIVNYKCISKEWKKFKKYDMWCADEFHYLKNRTSNRSKAMAKLSEYVPYHLAMTATPITKDPLDLFSQINILDPDIFPNRYNNYMNKVAKTYEMELDNGRTITKPYDFTDEGIEWINSKIYTRAIRYRLDECTDIPEKQYERIAIDMPPIVDKFYKGLIKNRIGEIGQMGSKDYKYVDASNGLAVVTYARQVASGFIGIENDEGDREYHTLSDFKVQALMELLETFDTEDDEQVIVWYRHKHLLKMIENALSNHQKLKRKRYAVINGDVDGMGKAAISSKFRKGRYDYILASIDVTEGWQGQSARYAVWLENHFTFDKREQAEGRIHRKGQTRQTVMYDITTNGSIDNKILKSILKGESLSEQVLAENIPDWAPFI